MKCFTCRNGVVTSGIKVERASIAGGTREIDAVTVGNRNKGGSSTLVSVHERGIPPDRILFNATNIITRSGKHGLSPVPITDRDNSGVIILFDTDPPEVGDVQYLGECIKECTGADGIGERHFIPFPGTVLARGTVVRDVWGKPRTTADHLLAVLPRGVVASISYLVRTPSDPALFLLYDGKELHCLSLSARKRLPEDHPLSDELCQHFLALNEVMQ